MTETVKKKPDCLAVRLKAKLHSDPLQAPETERLIVPDSPQRDLVHVTLVTNKATFSGFSTEIFSNFRVCSTPLQEPGRQKPLVYLESDINLIHRSL